MYTKLEIDQAIQLWRQTGSPTKTISILGYPSLKTLKRWVRDFRAKGYVVSKNQSGLHSKFSKQQKKTAIERVLANGGSIARTIRELGYPSRTALKLWLKSYRLEHPELTMPAPVVFTPATDYTDKKKMAAVREKRRKKRSVISIARELGISRQTLYAWAREFPMPVNPDDASTMSPTPKPKAQRPTAHSKTPKTRLEVALNKVEELEKQPKY